MLTFFTDKDSCRSPPNTTSAPSNSIRTFPVPSSSNAAARTFISTVRSSTRIQHTLWHSDSFPGFFCVTISPQLEH